MRISIGYTTYPAYSNKDHKWWSVYLFYPNGIWDEEKRTFEEAIEEYPIPQYSWELFCDNCV